MARTIKTADWVNPDRELVDALERGGLAEGGRLVLLRSVRRSVAAGRGIDAARYTRSLVRHLRAHGLLEAVR
jgi:hypothetical protein